MILSKKFDGLSNYSEILHIMEERVNNVAENFDDEIIYLVEHEDVITSGTSSNDEELKFTNNIPIFPTGRGGKYTYHGPGQRVIYPVLDLKNPIWNKDLKKYLNFLHELIIEILDHFKIKAHQRDDHIGVWVNDGLKDSKIAAIGIRARKWVVFHGFAVNINTDLKKFDSFVPCGISDLGVTSFKKLGLDITMDEFDNMFFKIFNKKIEILQRNL